jgi:hypothetical protein
MARKQAKQAKGMGRLLGAAKAVKKMFTRGRDVTQETTPAPSSAGSRNSSSERMTKQGTDTPARVTRREADIPLDVIGQTYTPPATSSKAGFRSDGSDHQRDQEFATGVAESRWKDQDQLTNKSGDPRIGTHRRTYEPEEARAESRE